MLSMLGVSCGNDIALGASGGSVIRLIVGQGVLFAIAGVALGSAVALLASRRVEPMLFGVSARDPTIYATVAAVLLVVATAATLRPALRALKVDPLIALRHD